MIRNTRGYTLVEMVMVLVVAGILLTIISPKLTALGTKLTVRSSTQKIATYLAQARAAAIENGRPAAFIRNGNTIAVAVDTGTKQVAYTGTVDLFTEHGVTLSATQDTVRFDPRGIASGLGSTLTIVVSKASIRDSVCVIGLGRISTKDCGL